MEKVGVGAAAGRRATHARASLMTAAERAIVADDGRAIRLALYRGADALAVVALAPVVAIGLARALIEAAHRRLIASSQPPAE